MTEKLYHPIIKKIEVDDTHYYWIKTKRKNDKNEAIWRFVPSVTKILETMPMPFALRKWIGDVGTEKAESKLEAAGDRGTKIHHACEQLLVTGSLGTDNEPFQQLFPVKQDQKCIVGFIEWVNEFKPELKKKTHVEMVVASRLNYAGTLDIFCYINNEPYIVDIKTSNAVHDSHKLQLAAYKQAFQEMTGIKVKMGILHLNSSYKKGYSFYTEDKARGNLDIKGKKVSIKDFKTVYRMYVMLNRGIPEPPKTTSYPEKLILFTKKENGHTHQENLPLE